MRRFKGPNDVEEARQAVHKVSIATIKRVPLSFHILSFTIGWQDLEKLIALL